MLFLFPLTHCDKPQIGFVFKYEQNLLRQIKSQAFIKYSITNRCYYIPYQSDQYANLKALGIPLTVCASRPNLSLELQNDINEKQIYTINKVINESTNKLVVTITYNNGRLWITMPYNTADIQIVKSLSGAYWNKNHLQWSIYANIENLDHLQAYFNCLSVKDYHRIYNLIRMTTEPKIVEIYSTPEYGRDKVCIKLKGYGIDTNYISQMPSALYDVDMKRWLVPHQALVLSKLQCHYTSLGAKIIDRTLQNEHHHYKKEYTNLEKQNFLMAKYPEAFHELLKLYINSMIRTNRKWSTIYTYTPEFFKFTKEIGVQNVCIATSSQINAYLSQLALKQKYHSVVHTAINAIKYYYQKVIFCQDVKLEQIVRPKGEFHLPTILSTHEINRVLESLANIKHISIQYIFYGCGLRLNELLSLKVDDVWWDRNQLIVRNGKGNKDRVVNLGQTLKQLLKVYFDQYQPQYWLFEGQDRIHQYSARSVQKVVKNAVQKAGIIKNVSPHTLRHCFATHLLDNGVQLPYIQALLGHSNIKTTMIYTHVTTQSVANVLSPLDGLNLTFKKP